jgi:hypothetical protein
MSLFAPKSELALVFDISSSSIGAGLVELSCEAQARVLHTLREPIRSHVEADSAMLLKDMVRALKLAHEKIIKQGGAHLAGTEFKYIKINRTLYSFASPWAVTQTKTLSMKKAEPFEFTPELLTGLIKSQEDRFKKESLEVIERRVIHTRLNGYEVHDPLGKKANSAEVSFFSGIVPKLVIDRIMDISHSTFRLSKHIQVSSFPLISYSAIRDTFHGENDFICVRIDSRVSDISIVADGLIDESGSFPGGQNHIINVISRHLRMSKEETISFLKLYIVGNAESKLVEKFEPLLDRLMGDWVRSLREMLEKLEGNMFLPQKLFLVMDGELAPYFVKALESDATVTTGEFGVPFIVTLIHPNTLKDSVTYESQGSDSPLALISAFLGRVFETEKK